MALARSSFRPAVRAAAAAAAAILLCSAAVIARPLLEDGDRMVFLGDSITAQRIHTRYVMNYFALRYPDTLLTFRNSGWSGERAPGGLARLDRDVLSVKPDVVSICYGMNDGGVTHFDRKLYANFMDGMTGLVDRLKGAGARVVLLPPGVVDPDRKNWNAPERMAIYNPTLARFSDGVILLAKRENLPYYDLNRLMTDVQKRAKADDPAFTMIPDGVHPSAPGQALMAYAMLKALGCDEQASGLTIDAATGKTEADRCRVSGLKIGKDEISFTRTDAALPTYFDPEAEVIFRYCPIPEELNRYMFRVSGLSGGSWTLTVEGIETGAFTSGELAAGVSLSGLPGPWKTLGEEVNRLTKEQEALFNTRWRDVFLKIPPEGSAEMQAQIADLDRQIAEREKARARAVRDRTWKWKLTRQP